MKIHEIIESASAGATSSGNIAAVVNPSVAHSKNKPKNLGFSKPKMQKPTDNALDADTSLFNGGVLKRNEDTALAAL